MEAYLKRGAASGMGIYIQLVQRGKITVDPPKLHVAPWELLAFNLVAALKVYQGPHATTYKYGCSTF